MLSSFTVLTKILLNVMSVIGMKTNSLSRESHVAWIPNYFSFLITLGGRVVGRFWSLASIGLRALFINPSYDIVKASFFYSSYDVWSEVERFGVREKL